MASLQKPAQTHRPPQLPRQRKQEQSVPEAPKPPPNEPAVVRHLAPEVTNPEKAHLVADEIRRRLPGEGARALAAQERLDEERVRRLLEED